MSHLVPWPCSHPLYLPAVTLLTVNSLNLLYKGKGIEITLSTEWKGTCCGFRQAAAKEVTQDGKQKVNKLPSFQQECSAPLRLGPLRIDSRYLALEMMIIWDFFS